MSTVTLRRCDFCSEEAKGDYTGWSTLHTEGWIIRDVGPICVARLREALTGHLRPAPAVLPLNRAGRRIVETASL